jgi:hypothetical protein
MFQKFGVAKKSNRTAQFAMILMGLISFNWNGVKKSKFLKHANTDASHFSSDTKELRDMNFMIVIGDEIFINPSMLWAGSDRNRERRQECYDLGVVHKDDLPTYENFVQIEADKLKEKRQLAKLKQIEKQQQQLEKLQQKQEAENITFTELYDEYEPYDV